MTNHCNHECVCLDFRYESEIAFKDHTPCIRNHDGCKSCKNDTRLIVKGDETDVDICKKCLPAYQRVGCSCSDMYEQKLILNWMNDFDLYIKNSDSCENYATTWNFLKRKIESFQNNSLSTGQQEIVSSTDIINDLEKSLDRYKTRINMLQCWQSLMRDPERKIVCDILANGFTLVTKEEIIHSGNICNTLLNTLDHFVISCQQLHAPDCIGSKDGVKDCDGCKFYDPVTIEQIQEKIELLRNIEVK